MFSNERNVLYYAVQHSKDKPQVSTGHWECLQFTLSHIAIVTWGYSGQHVLENFTLPSDSNLLLS